MAPVSLSPLATPATPAMRGDLPPRRQEVPFGVCVHSTGRGVPGKARKLRVDPMRVALDVYLSPVGDCPHYVIDYDGKIAQVADERLRARHAGVPADERAAYLDGSWVGRVAAVPLERWRRRWPGFKSPQHLYPTTSPNEAYLGIECIPLLEPRSDDDPDLFTDSQYRALGALIADVETRWGISCSGPRLVGHEDVEPLTRWTSRAGWDPGSLSARPAFRWDRLGRVVGAGL